MKKPAGSTAGFCLFDFARALLTVALTGEGFFGTALFTRFQVKRMPLDLFYDVFLLNFTFKTSQSAFKRLAILKMDFCQLNSPAFNDELQFFNDELQL